MTNSLQCFGIKKKNVLISNDGIMLSYKESKILFIKEWSKVEYYDYELMNMDEFNFKMVYDQAHMNCNDAVMDSLDLEWDDGGSLRHRY